MCVCLYFYLTTKASDLLKTLKNDWDYFGDQMTAYNNFCLKYLHLFSRRGKTPKTINQEIYLL